MSVDTLYKLELSENILEKRIGNNYRLQDFLDGVLCSWYHHEKDLIELSSKYPEVTFKLKGVCEDIINEGFEENEVNTNIWVKVFKNGKVIKTRFASINFNG